MTPIVQTTCELAWLEAAEHLAQVSDNSEYNLVVEIAKPTWHTAADLRVRATVDQFLRRHNTHPISTVAGTIFPAAEYVNHGVRGVYEFYPEQVYPAIKESTEWGRYAYRLVRWETASGRVINPLEILIGKMKQQLTNGRRMRACYELSLADSAIDLPLYDPTIDAHQARGGPCLSHVSLKLGAADTLYLTALYRSHSYVARALGNFLGLADLQAFICEQTGLSPGPLMSVSSYSRLETDGGWSRGEALHLVRDARSAFNGAVHAAA